MNEDQDPNAGVAAPVFVEDVFLTDVFLIKGRLANKTRRLSNVLEDYERRYLKVQDATLVSLRTDEVIQTPVVMVSVDELILAHELVDVAGDDGLRRLADNDKSHKIRAFYNGSVQFEVGGRIEPGAYESNALTKRSYFIMAEPVVRGLDLNRPELALLKNLPYAILKKDRMAYVYDFS
ncbi:MAG TPA: hypothetical protein ENI87_10655 [bacterium]|nr:hypothetical protein [bacterium]